MLIGPKSMNQPPFAPKTQNRFSHIVRLVIIGVLTQLIYVCTIVAFPLVSNTLTGGPAADLEILMRDFRWFAPIYAAAIFLLYYLFWQATQTVARLEFGALPSNNHAPQSSDGTSINLSSIKTLVLVFGLLFAFTLIWLYPTSANDLFRYVVRGRVWAVYGQSPLATPPDAFPDDPYTSFAGEFAHLASVYGPLWEVVVQVPLQLGATSMVAGTVGVKLMVLLAYLACAVLLGWVAIPEKSSALMALTFFAWNPLILMQGLGNGHNDMVFMALMVLGHRPLAAQGVVGRRVCPDIGGAGQSSRPADCTSVWYSFAKKRNQLAATDFQRNDGCSDWRRERPGNLRRLWPFGRNP